MAATSRGLVRASTLAAAAAAAASAASSRGAACSRGAAAAVSAAAVAAAAAVPPPSRAASAAAAAAAASVAARRTLSTPTAVPTSSPVVASSASSGGVASSSSSAAAAAAAAAADDSLWELRVYDIAPEHYPAFVALCEEYMHIRLEASECVGYWASEMGGVNQTVHIWRYDSYDHRTEVRKQLGAHPVWAKEFMPKMRKLIQKQSNLTMRRESWLPLGTPNVAVPGAGFYELRMEHLAAGQAPDRTWSDSLKTAVNDLNSAACVPLGAFTTDIGPRAGVQFWYWPTLGDRDAARAAAVAEQGAKATSLEASTSSLVTAVDSKLMQPLSFSPMQ